MPEDEITNDQGPINRVIGESTDLSEKRRNVDELSLATNTGRVSFGGASRPEKLERLGTGISLDLQSLIGKFTSSPGATLPASPPPPPGQVKPQGGPHIIGDYPSASWFVGQWMLRQENGFDTWVTITVAAPGQFGVIEASHRKAVGPDPFKGIVQAKHARGHGRLRPDGVSLEFDVTWGSGSTGRYTAWWEGNGTTLPWKLRGNTTDLAVRNGPVVHWDGEKTSYDLTPDEARTRATTPQPDITIEWMDSPTTPNGRIARFHARGFDEEMVRFSSHTTGPGLTNTEWTFIGEIQANLWGNATLPGVYQAYIPVDYRVRFKASGMTSGKESPERG